METKASAAMGHDGRNGFDAHADTWNVRRAVGASTPVARGTAVVGAVVALLAAVSSDVPIAAAVPVALLVLPALVDVVDGRLPDRMVGAAAVAGFIVAGGTVVSGGDIDFVGASVGVAVFAGPLLVMHLVAPSSMGFGDVKAGCVLGAAVGSIHPFHALLALAVGSLLGLIAGVVGRRRTIAFGPALVGGAIVALVLAASPVEVFEPSAQHPTEDVSP